MKNHVLLFLTFVFFHLISAAQSMADLGNSGYNQSENYQLVPTTYSSAKMQVIIRVSELIDAGLTTGSSITGIAYYVQKDNTTTTIKANWYADLTTAQEFTSTTFLPRPTLRAASTDAGTFNKSWRMVSFSSPIIWDGTSNLLVQSCRTSTGQSNSDLVGYYSTDTWSSSLTGYLNHGCNDATGDMVQSLRPQMAVTFIPLENTLPVTFVSLNALQKSGTTELTWKVANEAGILSYQVERSATGTNFTPVATVTAAGHSSYTWIDALPGQGSSFYRVRSIEQAGRPHYSTIVKVNTLLRGHEMQVVPNPIRTGNAALQFTAPKEGTYVCKVHNMGGQLVYTGIIQHNGGSSSHALNFLKTLKPGLYSVQLQDAGNKIAETKITVL